MTPAPDSVTLFVPTLNELGGMRVVMPRVRPEWAEQVLVVDGGSTDGTVEYARERGYEVYVQKRRGLHHAYREAWPLVRGGIVVTFSPDGNCVPELIPDLVAKVREGFDMVIASRYLPGAKAEDDTPLTRFGNWMFTRVLINGLHGGRYTDSFNIFRAYRTRLYYDLGLDDPAAYAPERLWCTVSGVEPLLSTRAVKRRVKVAEIPGDEPARLAGTAKLQMVRWGGTYLFQIVRELWYWR